ncbi:DUF4974 domain-containing protein [Pseudoflavitalea sp. G-6-1-2]|uniref:FecR family protein n=1 Tax=Pseudoflavitalea sp. G-6-1-2 TaxID=2728841 RepID=UPI00146B0370|nr:FecR family protein [Pseudoflavitalea sp. G-6-1-2]NML21484.1 DUF4974 domain-containing protein [Pseudoflavitalea sp. G-6-1-2]
MEEKNIAGMFRRYFDKTCTEEERMAFLKLIASGDHEEELKQLLEEELQHFTPGRKLDAAGAEALFSQIRESIADPKPAPVAGFRRSLVKKLAIAATLLLLVSAGTWFLLNNSSKKKKHTTGHPVAMTTFSPTPTPSGDQAVLELADGTKVILDSSGVGQIAKQGNASVIRKDGGELIYEYGKGEQGSKEPQYNTLSTPLGRQYKLRLPDGSRVWLNAASSIRYPTAFTGKERTVTISGEAYFEVEKNAAQPFVVRTLNMDVEVLGTDFNVNSYNDEPVSKTTLVEGAVRVSSLHHKEISQTIQPGEQAQLAVSTSTTTLQIKEVDTEAVTAWKNGLFHFEGTPTQEVMRQIARWYNADITCEGRLGKHFRGVISRTATMEEVFHMLSLTGEFKYKIEGRKVTITP